MDTFAPQLRWRAVKLSAVMLWLILCVFSSSLLFASVSNDRSNTLHFGVFSYLGDEQTYQKFAPLVEYLNSVLEDEWIELHVLSQEKLNERISEGSIDIVTTNPTHFLVARSQFPLTGVIATLVQSYDGVPSHYLGGVILTLAHRDDIGSLRDIHGKVVATPSRDNLGGYRAQVYELHLAGIRVPDDLSALIEVGTHRESVRALLDGRADVAFVRDGIMEQLLREGFLPERSIKLLNAQINADFIHKLSTRLYPEWPVFALPHVDERAVRHIAAALFSLDSDNPLAMQAGIYGFTVPADYQAVETLSRTLRLPPYDQLPDFTLKDAWQRWQFLIIFVAVAVSIIFLLSLGLVWLWRKAHVDRDRFGTLLQGLGEGVYGTDKEGRCTFINEAATQMLQTSSKAVLGKDQHSLFHHHYQDGRFYPYSECPITQTLNDGRKRELREWFIRQDDGRHFPVDLTVTPLFNKDSIVGAVVAFSDITRRVKVEEENKRLTQYNRMLLESAGDGIYGIDMHGKCTFINPAALKMLGFNAEEVLGQDPHQIFHYCYPDGSDYPSHKCPVHLTKMKGVETECEDHFINSEGESLPVHLKVSPIFEDQAQVGVVVVFQNITEQKALQARLITLTTTDDLTGLYNRRYFQKQLSKEFARFQRSFAETAVLMLDLDFFKQINDTYGHAAGDKVLKDFAELLLNAQRNSDFCARVGGEEFALLLPDTSLSHALSFANRLTKQVREAVFSFNDKRIPLTVSIGCTHMYIDDSHPDMVLARADRALYQAKESGRDRVVAYGQ
ncbi:diguanylate cyclase [Nitrincola schmidtii]|uniref:diguanylate cyclase n=1 Tax=Nitrincola schmidtii TaxID=1730894 RepID=UPI00124C86D6|nr:diguanylate cyclase [Nitrincola schmidtii]